MLHIFVEDIINASYNKMQINIVCFANPYYKEAMRWIPPHTLKKTGLINTVSFYNWENYYGNCMETGGCLS